MMKIPRGTVPDLIYAITFLQWAWFVGSVGGAKFGLLGWVGGAVVGAGTYPLSFAVAWIFMPVDQTVWFYGVAGVGVVAFLAQVFLRRGQDARVDRPLEKTSDR